MCGRFGFFVFFLISFEVFFEILLEIFVFFSFLEESQKNKKTKLWRIFWVAPGSETEPNQAGLVWFGLLAATDLRKSSHPQQLPKRVPEV